MTLQIEVEDVAACRKRLRIAIPAEQVTSEFDEVLTGYMRAARIPGFRPGKAPRPLVQKRYHKEIEEEVKDRLIPEGYRSALKEKAIEPLTVLGVEDVQFAQGSPLTFSVTLDVPPDFKLPAYRGIAIKAEPAEVADAEVDETIERVVEAQGRYEDIEPRAVQADDLVQVDFTATMEGEPLEEAVPEAKGLGQAEDFWVHAGENAFLSEFATALIGLEPGASKVVEVAFPADFHQAGLAGKQASYAVEVKALRERARPELTDEFYQSLGVASAEELRSRVREDLESAATSRETSRRKSEIVKHLMEITDMDLPGSVVEEETRSAIYDMVRENASRGVSQDQIEENRDQIFQAAGRTAGEKVKIRYILGRIAAEEKIEVSPSDVDERVRDFAARYGMTEEQMREQMQKQNMLDGLAEQLRFDRVLDLLLEEADIKG